MIAFFSFLGLAAGLSRITRLPAACSPVAVATALIGVLYPAAALGCVKEAVTMLQALGVSSLAVLSFLYGRRRLWSSRTDWRTVVRRVIADIGSVPPAVILLLVSGCGLWLSASGAHFYLSDEFSHWGSAVKQILLTDRLPIAGSPLPFQAYPPGATLFDTFFLTFGHFQESGVLFG